MRINIGMAVLAASLAAASNAAAQNCELERLHIRSSGDGVSADFSSVDTSTCALGIETDVHVEASEGVITTADLCGRGGNSIKTVTIGQTNVVAILVTVYDNCLGTLVRTVTGTGEADELHVSNNFKTGSLQAAFDGVDDSNQTVAVAIDLVWTGVGAKEKTVDHVNNNQGVVRFVSTSSGTIRDAVAVGSATLDGAEQLQSPSTQGTLEQSSTHELVVYR
jgi:hypothetical protein